MGITVLALLSALLLYLFVFMRIKIIAFYKTGGEVSIKLKIGYYPLNITGGEKKPPKADAEVKKKARKKPPKKKKEGGDNSVAEKFKAYFGMAGSKKQFSNFIMNVLGRCKNSLRIELVRAVIIIGGADDAAQAAINYGRYNAAMAAAISVLSSFFVVDRKELGINVNFTSKDMFLDLGCIISVTTGKIIAVVCHILYFAIKNILLNKNLSGKAETSYVRKQA